MEYDILIFLIVRYERNNCSEFILVKIFVSLVLSFDFLVIGMGKVKIDLSFLLFMVCICFF